MFLLLYMVPNCFAQAIPPPATQTLPTCDQNFLTTRVTQEHQLTRKFMIDTYNEKSELFFREADSRMTYLENEYKRQLNKAVFTLGFLWLFIMLFVMSLFGLLGLWLRQRQYKKLKKDVTGEVMRQIQNKIDDGVKVNVIKERPSIDITPQLPVTPPKMKVEHSSLEEIYARMQKLK